MFRSSYYNLVRNHGALVRVRTIMMDPVDLPPKYQERYKRRDKKREKRWIISGGSVFRLAELIANRINKKGAVQKRQKRRK